MAIRKIVKRGDDVLTRKCRRVERFDDKLCVLLDDMADTLDLEKGCGLAANQVGILRRIVIIDVGDGIIELINPEIISAEGEQKTVEGCLSIPNVWGITIRPAKVTARAQDRHGNTFEITGEELLAKAICHELDHLDGVLFTEYVIEYIEPEDMEEDEAEV